MILLMREIDGDSDLVELLHVDVLEDEQIVVHGETSWGILSYRFILYLNEDFGLPWSPRRPRNDEFGDLQGQALQGVSCRTRSGIQRETGF